MDTESLNSLVFSNSENGTVELDASTLAGLKKMPVANTLNKESMSSEERKLSTAHKNSERNTKKCL